MVNVLIYYALIVLTYQNQALVVLQQFCNYFELLFFNNIGINMLPLVLVVHD